MQGALRFFYVTLFFLSMKVHAFDICDDTKAKPCLVQDSPAKDTYPASLRNAGMIAEYFHGPTYGVEELYISGSQEPTELGWNKVAEFIRNKQPNLDQPVVVLDLRQESHGYVNGLPLTWVSHHNWQNRDKPNAQSQYDEEMWLSQLSSERLITNILTPKQYANKQYSKGKSLMKLSVKSESQVVSRLGFVYHRLYISDHMGPQDSEIEALVRIFKKYPKNTWYHVHCRAGKGRTTTVMAMYDIYRNADTVSFKDIIARQASIPPFYDLSVISQDDPELTPGYEQRIAILRQFYEFSRASLLGYQGSWTEWHKVKKLSKKSINR
jgi:hypothetical protein